MRHFGAILLAAVLVAGCASSGSSPSPLVSPAATTEPSLQASSSPVSSPSAAVSPVPSSTPSVAVATQTTWSRVADQPAFSDGFPTSVVAGPDRYVAVGCGSTAKEPTQDECIGVAWVSTDARTWRRVTVPTTDGTYLSGVIASPVGYLAWAYGTDGTPGAVVWRSADGLTWQRASAIPSSAYEDIGAVVWFKDRFIALAEWNEPRAWSSTDGLSWTEIPTPAGCTAAPTTNLLVVFRDRLVALGEHPARSIDGACWTAASTPFRGWPTDATVVGGTLVVVGNAPAAREAAGVLPPLGAWTSTDGVAFSAARFDGTVPTGGFGAVALGDRLVALGTAVVAEVLTPMAWESADGRVWEPSTAPDATKEGIYMPGVDCTGGPCTGYRTGTRAMTDGPAGLVAVGSTRPTSGGTRMVVWLASSQTVEPPVVLPVGRVAVTLVGGLRVRSQPRVAADSAMYEPLLAKGTELHVLAEPVFASGLWWYHVAPYVSQGSVMVPLRLSGGATDGWVAAAARDGTPWIGSYQDVDCGPQPCAP